MGRPGANGVSHREGCLRSTTRTPHATSPSPTTPSHTCSHTRRCTATSLGRFIWSVHRDQIPPSPLQCTVAAAAYSELTTSLLQCTAGCLPAGRHEPRMPDTAEVSAARPLQLQVLYAQDIDCHTDPLYKQMYGGSGYCMGKQIFTFVSGNCSDCPWTKYPHLANILDDEPNKPKYRPCP
jgi:hypothetical protein